MPLKNLPSRMTRGEFCSAFAEIFEKSPWVAEGAFERGITAAHDSPETLLRAMQAVVSAAGREAQLRLILSHPELGAKEKMGDFSTQEQMEMRENSAADYNYASAFRGLNAAYRKKFGIPFIMAVKHATADVIVDSMRERLQNETPDTAFRRALDEIGKIALGRLQMLW